MIFNLFLIGLICVFIIDYSGIIDTLDKGLTKVFKSRVPLHIPKPFSCSLCSTWWAGLIYLLIISKLNLLNIAILGLVCTLTPEMLSIIYFIKDLINKIFDMLEKWLKIF